MTTISTTYLLLLGAAMATSAQAGSLSACDINQDGTTNVGDVQGLINQALGVTQATTDLNEDGVVNVVDAQIVINAALGLGCSALAAPAITGFSPQSAPVGTVITVTGKHLQANTGTAAQFTLAQQGGGTMTGFASSGTATTLLFIVPAGAATGVPSVTVNGQTGSAATPLTILPSATFSLNATPGTANLIQGQSASFAINLTSTTGFDTLAALSVGGVPAGVTTAFKPQNITAGQTSILTLTASGSQPIATLPLAITATAMVTGLPVTQTGNVSLMVTAPTTSFLGRTVISDTMETPIAGVTIAMLGKDGNGNTTGCSGGTVSDGAGNFLLANLPASCVGPQLVGFNGTTVTAPPGIYAGVNLVYTFVAGQVTASPVLVHLPRIDTVETFNVTQNSSVNQTYAFATIPGLSVTVYAGTTFTLQDGAQPNPFPLAAVQVPPDRLPDLKPNVPTMIRAFIVAFQPANATTNQPVAVYFPNTLNTAPGTDMVLMTLDPTHGQMVPYGTGAVSPNATQIVPDPDPAHPGHLYGLVHFDWHGDMPGPPPGPAPGPDPGCPGCCPAPPPSGGGPTGGPGPTCGGGGDPGGGGPVTGDPVDLSSGLQVIRATDLAIRGQRGSILISRTYRGMSNSSGPFGIGTNHNYGYQLATSSFINGQGLITLVMPDGNQYPFAGQPYGSLTNSTIPAFIGAVMTSPSSEVYNLRMKDGTTWVFASPSSGALIAYMNAIVDSNGNTITLLHGNSTSPVQITQMIDPVGRALNLSYDASDRITSITDPIGRTVGYTYNAQGTLATVTDAAGGVTQYAYDSQNRMVQINDARGIVVAQNTYDVNGRVIQQVQADGGVISIAYTLLNSLVATSPVLLTAVTDALGNVTTYHFDPTGNLLDVTDPMGQVRIFSHNVQLNNMTSSVTGSGSCPVCGNPRLGNVVFTYDSNGNLATRTDALGNTTAYTYEPVFNKVTSVTDPLGNVVKFTYDARGNRLTVTDPNGSVTTLAYNSFGQPTGITDPLGRKSTFSYSGIGDLIAVADPLGDTSSFGYDDVSRRVQLIDAMGRKTTRAYDGLNRIVLVTNAQGGQTPFVYDAVGNLLSATDENGRKTAYTYDAMSRMTTRTDPRGKADTRTYDFEGNLIQYVDRRGQSGAFTYDALNRPTGLAFQDGSTVAGSYDANSRLGQVVDSQGGSFDYVYDSAGRLVSQASQFGAVQYAYDGAGKTVSLQVAGQPAVTYSYDPASNLLSASLPQATANFTYDAAHELLTLARSNSVSSEYMYDSAGRFLSITHQGAQMARIPFTYSYDAAGDRLLYATTVPQSASNTFDTDGRLTQSGGTSYTYDDNGNVASASTAGETTTYSWDTRNRLRSISASNGQQTVFTYDFTTNLMAQVDSGPALNLIQTFVLDRTNVAYIGRSVGDNLSVLAGRRIDQHLAVVHASGQVEYGLADAMNSTAATIDQNGSLVSSFSYDPFGKTSANSTYPFQFTGRVPVNGSLYYYRARYYESAVGRFGSEDPLGPFRGGTAYVYAGNSPLVHSDPTGLDYFACIIDCTSPGRFIGSAGSAGAWLLGTLESPLAPFAGAAGAGAFIGSLGACLYLCALPQPGCDSGGAPPGICGNMGCTGSPPPNPFSGGGQ